MANYLGGIIASLTGGHGGGRGLDACRRLHNTPTSSQQSDWCWWLAVLIAVCNKPPNKLMHGVR